MFTDALASHLRTTLSEIDAAGLYKRERLIDSTQNSTVRLKDGREVINMCANNYLGLADHPEVVAAAKASLDRWGFGMAPCR
ncbi:MAG TPA: glycine C-acetyltransferase, partial [Haloferula sp.]